MASEPTASAPSSPRRHRRGWLVLFVLLPLAVGLAWWLRGGSGDLTAAAEANSKGIACLEWFSSTMPDGRPGYDAAAAHFEEAVRRAPSWTPAKINLGIALFNTTDPPKIDRAVSIFNDVLKSEPDNIHANYCLGIIIMYRGDADSAYKYFDKVTKLDPNDAHGWLHRALTTPNYTEVPEAKADFEKALKLDPYLNAARYNLAVHGHNRDEKRMLELFDERNKLVQATWEREYSIRYTDMGRYGNAIGTSPAPRPDLGPFPLFDQTDFAKIALAPNTTWAKPGGIGTIITLDYDKDSRPDLLVLSAVTTDGKTHDLLLHNDGGGQFSDVSAKLGSPIASTGGAVADFDNSGFCDLVLTTANGIRLLKNSDGTTFEDVTTRAGMNTIAGPFGPCAWVDLDQDGDLDLLLGRQDEGGLFVFLNSGEAPAVAPNLPIPPLTVDFKRFDSPALKVSSPVRGLLLSDIDGDTDVDLVVLSGDAPPRVIMNDRLLRFHDGPPLVSDKSIVSGTTIDVNHDDQSDLVLLGTPKPVLLVSASDAAVPEPVGRFTSGISDSPSLVQAHAADIDLDGRTDLVGLSDAKKAVVLRGDSKLLGVPLPFGPAVEGITDLLAVNVADVDGDCQPDVIVWSAANGLKVFRNLGTTNHGVRIELVGKRDNGSSLRTNNDGVGARVRVTRGAVSQAIENTTLTAGLGQSRLPFIFGLGKSVIADSVRVRWPDNVPQAEVNIAGCDVYRVVETNRKGTSCPILFTWDGTRYRYVTDFLGGGALGEAGADGSIRPPRPEESVKIESTQLVSRDGLYRLVVAEPMDELLYLDELQLDVIDHPAQSIVYPNERFVTSGPQPDQQLLTFTERFAPTSAVDHTGADVLGRLKNRDGNTVDTFRIRSWMGYAEDHHIDLDFGNQLSGVGADRSVFLILAGWTDYPYPESIYAAAQAGVPMKPPVLERQQPNGTWQVIGDLGFPAGLPRVMTAEVKGLTSATKLKLRIRTNLQIFWDEITLGVVDSKPSSRVVSLPVERAALVRRGFMQETMPTGRPPIEYDYDRLEPVAATAWKGRLTRLGEVTELLKSTDDHFVLCGPGEEIQVAFDGSKLPPVAVGWKRSFVLRTAGYCKDTATFTMTGGSVNPLPYRGMTSYPDGANDRAQAPQHQTDYDAKWNTRPAAGGPITSASK